MFWRRALGATAALALLAAASWLPGHLRRPSAQGTARAATAPAAGAPAWPEPAEWAARADLARPALRAPAAWPVRPPGPAQAVSAFLWTLSVAVAGAPAAAPAGEAGSSREPAADGDSPEVGQSPPIADAVAQPFARAYAYLAPSWQAAQDFQTFLRHWSGVRRLDPLAVLPVGAPPGGDPRTVNVFAEVRLLLTPQAPDRPAVAFAEGIYTVVPAEGGWLLGSGALRTEDFGLGPPDGPEGPSPEAVAVAAARATARRLGRTASAATEVQTGRSADHQADVRVRLGDDLYLVRTYHLADGQWVALSVQR